VWAADRVLLNDRLGVRVLRIRLALVCGHLPVAKRHVNILRHPFARLIQLG
jgi:hypothetical protein